MDPTPGIPLAGISLFTTELPPISSTTEHAPPNTVVTAPDIDWQLVIALRRKATEQITRTLRENTTAGPTDRRLLGRATIRTTIRDHAHNLSTTGQALWPIELEHAYAQAVENAIYGYGRLQPLFEISDAENIEINGYDNVTVQYGNGQRHRLLSIADSDEELVEAIRYLGETVTPARPFDDAHPTMTLGRWRNYLTTSDASPTDTLPTEGARISPRSLDDLGTTSGRKVRR